jgi:micrococcal nuclease
MRSRLPATLLLLSLLAGCTPPIRRVAPTPTPSPSPSPSPSAVVPVVEARVESVTDGDTARFIVAGTSEPVRFIGVDAPETTPRTDPYGKEAAAYTAGLLTVGKTVFLEKDVGDRDQFGRLLAYVWLALPTETSDDFMRLNMLNARLLVDGWARLDTEPPSVKYADTFTTYQTEARDSSRGLWQQAPSPAPAPTQPRPFVPPPKTAEPPPSENCDPAYPDFCIAPPPPDLDCPDVGRKNFTVRPPDPHKFDQDGDGRGCET